jgi:hypothetical protein
MQSWVSLMVCNFAVLASAFFKLSSTTPDGSIYSTSGRRVGAMPSPQFPTGLSPILTGDESANEEERSRSIGLSKLDVTIDLEQDNVYNISNG